MKKSLAQIVFILAPMVMALPLAMDIYVPAVPHIASLFGVSAAEMQLSLTVFMFTAGVMQLIVGPLSDHFGRKKISILTILLFAIGTLLCSYAQSAVQLILFRVLQAVGSCGMLVLALAIVRDLYSGDESARAYSFLNGVISFSPMFAPFIGSYLDVKYNWPSTFLALLFVALAAFLTISFGLKETLRHPQKLRWSFLQDYRLIARNYIFVIYTIASAMGLSYLYIFCSISSYIIIRRLHIPELHYGYYFFFMGVSFFIGSFISAAIVTKIGIYLTTVVGFFTTLIGGLLMAIWYWKMGLTINGFIWPMLLIGVGGTFCMGAGTGGSLEPFPDRAGMASALGGCFRFIFSAVVGSIVITSNVNSTLPLALPAIIFSVLGIGVFLFSRNSLDFHRIKYERITQDDA